MNVILDKILHANGISQNDEPQQQLQGIIRLIKREKIWFLATKILTGFFWSASLIILCFYMSAVKFFIHNQRGEISDPNMVDAVSMIMVLEIILPLVIIFAAVCTVFLYIRFKSVNLMQVHERLHNLEEMVKILIAK